MKHIRKPDRAGEERPIFVAYVYLRRCYNNPSMERFAQLPADIRRDMWARQEARRAKRVSRNR